MIRRNPAAALFRILLRITVLPNGCWRYEGRISPSGYGVVHAEGRDRQVHRYVYSKLIGVVPANLVMDHLCHNADLSCPGGFGCPHRRCCNPAHLGVVTRVVNGQTGRTGQHLAVRTHCPAGHPYAEFGVRYASNAGHRDCRECKRLRSLEWYRRRGKVLRKERASA